MQLWPRKHFFFPKTVPNHNNGGEIELLVKDDHPPALQNDKNLVVLGFVLQFDSTALHRKYLKSIKDKRILQVSNVIHHICMHTRV